MSKKEKYIAIEMDSREKEFKVILIIGQLWFFFFKFAFINIGARGSYSYLFV